MAFPKKKKAAEQVEGKVIPLAKAKVDGAGDKKEVAAKKAAMTPAPAPKPKAKKEPKVKRSGKLAQLYGGKKITVNTPANPKRGKSAERFDLYKTGMTTDAAVEAGVLWADIEYDQKPHAYVNKKGERVTGPFITVK